MARRADATTATTVVVPVVLLGLAAGCWVIAVRQMQGMDMGTATALGSFGSFIALWVAMMAAMMLPGALPAVVRRARAADGVHVLPLFAGVYLAVWALAGVVVYAMYRPHGTLAAGVVAIAAGVYELTPLGVMSITWMAVIAAVALMQKLLPPKAALDVPVAMAIAGLGFLILIAPSSVPGLTPSM